MDEAVSPYDEVPYASHPFAQSHPSRLAAIAHLFDMRSEPANDCRLVELGCASGGNLIPLAATFPRSQFIGVDLSARQIEVGQKEIADWGLTNVELRHCSILDITPEWGQFDYIVCHGVWSWVPAEVRAKILAVCGQNLAPHGVAYVSYNTYPGWHLRGSVRDMMTYRARKFATPQDRVGHARALLNFLANTVPEEKNPYGLLLRNEANLLKDKADSYLLHEHLETVNEPVYFHQFEEQARAQGLQFLGEADFGVMSTAPFGKATASVIDKLADNLIEREQYLDFLRNRMFRQTLLCRQDVTLDRQGQAERLREMLIATQAVPEVRDAKLATTDESKFLLPQTSFTTTNPHLKTALSLLAQAWPQALPFARLASQVQARLYREPVVNAGRAAQDCTSLAAALLDCYVKRFVELRVVPIPCATTAGELPLGFAVARRQAETGATVTNLLHQIVQLNDLGRHVLRLADGRRTHEDILNGLVDLAAGGEIVVHGQGDSISDPVRSKPVLAEALSRSLKKLARDALFVEVGGK